MAKIVNGAEYGAKHGTTMVPGGTRFQEKMGTPQGVATAMYPQFRDSVVYVEDDFTDDTISTTRWNLAADGTATTFAWASAIGGTIQGATGGSDNGYHAINGDVIWSGDKNAGAAIRFKIDVVTDFTFEFGFTDALDDETLPAVTDVDTPATGNGATDIAVIHLDTDQTLKTAAFVGVSTGSGYTAQKVNLATWAPSAGNWYTLVVQLNGDTAFCRVYDSNSAQNPILVAGSDKSLILALQGGTSVRPHFLVGTRTTSSRVTDVDFIRVWQDR